MWHTREPGRRESSGLLSSGGHSVPDVESGLVASREAQEVWGGPQEEDLNRELGLYPRRPGKASVNAGQGSLGSVR